MGAFETFPYTNFQNLNLDRLIKKTKETSDTVKDLKEYVETKIENQDAFLQESIKNLEEQIEENLKYIEENIQPIVESYINQQIESGVITVASVYDAETEALSIVISPVE